MQVMASSRREYFLFLILLAAVLFHSAVPRVSGCKRVSCRRRAFKSCFGTMHNCPSTCPETCKMDCKRCRPVCNCNQPGAVCDDPRFIGADGLTFYFHGQKDADFCLVSDTNLHINGHFIGKRGEGMKRDFTWVQSIGILFDSHKLFIGANKVGQWNDAVDQLDIVFDGVPVFLPETEGAQWVSPSFRDLTISRPDQKTNEIVVEATGKFRITAKVVPIREEESRIHGYNITADNCFAHLDLSFKFYALSGDVNGVLGQTYAKNYRSRVKMGVKMPVIGGDRLFSSSGIFAVDCAAARFGGVRMSRMGAIDHEPVSCKSSFSGHGIVCKK